MFPPGFSAGSESFFSRDERLAIIKSCATLYPTTASRLTSILDIPLPPTESFASLISLQPRIAKIQHLQDSQATELADLRLRSAAVLQRWYEIGVLGGGECWTDWEERVVGVEKLVRREEATKARQDVAI